MLTDAAIRGFACRSKRYSIADGNGLYIEIMPNGNKYWRMRVEVNGMVYRRSLGQYPNIGLKEARKIRDAIHIKIAMGEDPFAKRQSQVQMETKTFEEIAQEWLDRKVRPIRTRGHIRTITSRLNRLILPYIGEKQINEITPAEILSLLRRIEEREAYETAHRTLQICSQIFRYGIAIGQAERDITADLRGALVPVSAKRYPTITNPEEIRALMRAIREMGGSPIIRCALLLQAYTFVRPGELRKAEWDEFNLDAAEWRIPAEKMKMRRLHIVPLSRQAIEIVNETHTYAWQKSKYLFPNFRTSERPMSDATINAAIRRLGYSQEEFTGHGFRSMASTILNEHGWPADVIERQLAHIEKSKVRAAYNHAEYLDKRREMMQWWADWLDENVCLF